MNSIMDIIMNLIYFVLTILATIIFLHILKVFCQSKSQIIHPLKASSQVLTGEENRPKSIKKHSKRLITETTSTLDLAVRIPRSVIRCKAVIDRFNIHQTPLCCQCQPSLSEGCEYFNTRRKKIPRDLKDFESQRLRHNTHYNCTH